MPELLYNVILRPRRIDHTLHKLLSQLFSSTNSNGLLPVKDPAGRSIEGKIIQHEKHIKSILTFKTFGAEATIALIICDNVLTQMSAWEMVENAVDLAPIYKKFREATQSSSPGATMTVGSLAMVLITQVKAGR